MTVKEIRERLHSLLADMRSFQDRIDADKREFTAEENEQYAKMESDYDSLEKRLESAEKLEQREAAHGEWEERIINAPTLKEEKKEDPADVEARAFDNYLRSGLRGVAPAEQRALQVDIDTSGGYVVAPQDFQSKLIMAVDNLVHMRGLADVMQISKAQSLGAPSLDNDPADPTWTAEIATGSADSTMSFGKRELNPHPLAQRIKVSRTLLQRAVIGVDALVRDRLSYKIAVVQENAFLNGSGSGEPLGIFTASNDGVTTSQDVATDNGTTMVTTDGLINALYDLKEQYQRNATWIMHRDLIKGIRKLKDGNGEYIWLPGITKDKPSTILDRPYVTSEYAPNTFTTGLYVAVVADFSKYWIVDALGMVIQRLDELYAESNQVGFISRMETDGMPVLAEAFRRVKLG